MRSGGMQAAFTTGSEGSWFSASSTKGESVRSRKTSISCSERAPTLPLLIGAPGGAAVLSMAG